MLRSMYSGVSGMKGFQVKLDVIGNNVANVNTVGYKKSRVIFQDMLNDTIAGATAPTENIGGSNPRQIGLGVRAASIDVMHTAGSPTTTNFATDLVIDGDGFFAVSPTPDGQPVYLTRAGDFNRDAAGNLVNPQGYYVLGAGGTPVQIPRETYTSYSISSDGSILGTTPEGETETIETIGTVVVSNPMGLKKVGGSLYQMTNNANPDGALEILPPSENNAGHILSGQLEMSNVDLTDEFTDMIIAQRGFQANSRTITTSDEILNELVNLKR